MRIALATCSNLPDWEVDDQPLHAALRRRGVEIAHPVWDDRAVPWEDFDACLIRTTWDYMEKREAFVLWAEDVQHRTRLFNPASIVRWNTHKSYLRELGAGGAPVLPTVWLPRGAAVDVRAEMAARGWTRAFIKPMVGATARETLRVESTDASLDEAQAHLDRMLAAEDMMLQPYLPSVETEGERSAIFIDGRLSHAVRKVPVRGDYRVQDDFGAHDEPAALTEEEGAMACSVVGQVKADLLYARVDFLLDDAGHPRLTELELVEPSLFFRHEPRAGQVLAEALCRRIDSR